MIMFGKHSLNIAYLLYTHTNIMLNRYSFHNVSGALRKSKF